MPFTAAEITEAGLAALDFYLKNKPIDQVAVERPWMRKLMMRSKDFPGGKQFIVEQLRVKYDSNFQWYYGSQAVTYRKKSTLAQTQFPWRGAHDGFFLDEDTLLQNGISLVEGKVKANDAKERVQLTDLLQEHIETLRLGFEEQFDLHLHRDGTQDTEALAGLDYLVAQDPTTGIVGGIDRSAAANIYWRNNVNLAVPKASLIDTMEQHFRLCSRNGGTPDYIMVGSDFLDEFRRQAKTEITRYTEVATSGQPAEFDPSVTGLHFHRIPLVWNPVFSDLDTLESPTYVWEKRQYMLNCKHIRLRPARGHNMVSRKPPREYNRYVFYWALTWKGGLTMNRANCHSLLVWNGS